MDIKLEDPVPPKKKTEEKPVVEKSIEKTLGRGLDIGTAFILSAKLENEKILYKVQRDAFFNIENSAISKGMLTKLNANYIESEDKRDLYVIGEEALQMANFFNKESRRPLSKGVISTREKEALTMIKIILKAVLGEPAEKNEVCHFSVPAKPIDQDDYNVVYHENILKSFVSSFGYNAIPLNEATAVIWAELEEDNFTGMALSFGAGMVNGSIAYIGVSNQDQQFSISRSGDWVDENAAYAVGLKASRITVIKEQGVDLKNPKGREQEAIKIYYDNLIKYVCDGLERKLNSSTNLPNFPEPITVVVAGGTSKAINFEVVFEEELRKRIFPFQIKKVKKAEDQLNAVAKGCLLNSLNFYQQE